MNKNEEELIKELLESGSSSEEIKGLLSVAKKLAQVPALQRSENFKRQTAAKLFPKAEAKNIFSWPRIFVPVLAALFLIFISTTSIVAAQGSLPGETLYPLKRWSERVAILVVPGFKDDIPLRRSEEVKELIEQEKDFNLFKKTLDEYEDELDKHGEKDTPSTIDSKKNLEEAKKKASGEEKEELEKTLKKIEDNDKDAEDEGKVEGETSGPNDKHKDDKEDEDKSDDDND